MASIGFKGFLLFLFAHGAYAACDGRAASCASTVSQDLVFVQHRASRSSHRKMNVVELPPAKHDEYSLQQKITMRYLDAYEDNYNDYKAATRTAQGDDSQTWIITSLGNGDYTIQQKKTMRYLDAYEGNGYGYDAATRREQGDTSQEWVISPFGDGEYTIQQKKTMRYLDAWEDNYHDYGAATRSAQDNDSQKWIIKPLEAITPAPTEAPTPAPPRAYTLTGGNCRGGEKWPTDLLWDCIWWTQGTMTLSSCQTACDDTAGCGAVGTNATADSAGSCCLFKQGNVGNERNTVYGKSCYVAETP